ncbi:hypothetical protein IC757_04985 [Wenzhouxiangella sp. AB-CW3]|uniref:hypothetical protein n=1 Tax=Wenzhouxiangella sp. AB-CW3 TaxID=2771012 RepID=UPI00168B249E|nr:hypothetical protein [Wenzhouxiangella sp. AB-CW3]QOC23498.1 hypothetical protein IC757_04985 [Wenzhouxiangella sp. AB-CW3]
MTGYITEPEADWWDLVSGVGLGIALFGVLYAVAAYFAGLLATVTVHSVVLALTAMLGAILALLDQLKRLGEDDDTRGRMERI